DVDDQVRDHEYCHQQRHDRDDLGVLAGTDGIPQVEADPGDVEDGLRDDGASHEHPQVDADVGDHRDQRVAQHVRGDHPAAAEALGGGGAHVVLTRDLRDL